MVEARFLIVGVGGYKQREEKARIIYMMMASNVSHLYALTFSLIYMLHIEIFVDMYVYID